MADEYDNIDWGKVRVDDSDDDKEVATKPERIHALSNAVLSVREVVTLAAFLASLVGVYVNFSNTFTRMQVVQDTTTASLAKIEGRLDKMAVAIEDAKIHK